MDEEGHGQRFSRAMVVVNGQNLKLGQARQFSRPMKQKTKSGANAKWSPLQAPWSRTRFCLTTARGMHFESITVNCERWPIICMDGVRRIHPRHFEASGEALGNIAWLSFCSSSLFVLTP